MKARNVINNFDGLGVVWYTSANADFERGNTSESSDGTQKEVSSTLSLDVACDQVSNTPCF